MTVQIVTPFSARNFNAFSFEISVLPLTVWGKTFGKFLKFRVRDGGINDTPH